MCRGDKRDQSAEMQSPLVSSNQSRLRNMGWEIRIYDYSMQEKTLRNPQTQKNGLGNVRIFIIQYKKKHSELANSEKWVRKYKYAMQGETVRRTRKLRHRRVKSIY